MNIVSMLQSEEGGEEWICVSYTSAFTLKSNLGDTKIFQPNVWLCQPPHFSLFWWRLGYMLIKGANSCPDPTSMPV